MDSSEEKITQTLKVNIFPTYIIVKKTGEIIYQGNGDELFSYINNFKTILKNEQ
jgi:thioredoxin-related protein